MRDFKILLRVRTIDREPMYDQPISISDTPIYIPIRIQVWTHLQFRIFFKTFNYTFLLALVLYTND